MRFKTATIFLQKMMQVLMMSALLSFCCVVYANEHKHEIRIGILAKRGIDKTLERWKPMSDFLNERMENHTVTIVALPFDKVETAIANKNIDIILTNSSHYVTLEMKYGVSPIATMYNRVNNNLLLENFGGVIFTRSNRLDINSLKDTQGKRFAGVDE
jgi:ABC-type phosphate/phosphonate transport system substrate-binding protein